MSTRVLMLGIFSFALCRAWQAKKCVRSRTTWTIGWAWALSMRWKEVSTNEIQCCRMERGGVESLAYKRRLEHCIKQQQQHRQQTKLFSQPKRLHHGWRWCWKGDEVYLKVSDSPSLLTQRLRCASMFFLADDLILHTFTAAAELLLRLGEFLLTFSIN